MPARRKLFSSTRKPSGRTSQSFFLRQAYTSSAELPYALTVVPAQSVTPESVANHEVVVVNDVPRLPDKVRGSTRVSGQTRPSRSLQQLVQSLHDSMAAGGA